MTWLVPGIMPDDSDDRPRREGGTSAHACYAGDLSGHFDEPLWLPVDGAGGLEMSVSDPCLIRSRGPSGESVVRLGMPLSALMPMWDVPQCR